MGAEVSAKRLPARPEDQAPLTDAFLVEVAEYGCECDDAISGKPVEHEDENCEEAICEPCAAHLAAEALYERAELRAVVKAFRKFRDSVGRATGADLASALIAADEVLSVVEEEEP